MLLTRRRFVKTHLSPGSWSRSHSLLYPRTKHTSWVSGAGVVLLGGQDPGSQDTTELLASTGDSAEYFRLQYYTR